MKANCNRSGLQRPMCWAGPAGLLWAALAVQGVHASTLYDFEGFSDNTSLSNQLSGVTFSDATVFTAGISLNDIDYPPHSGDNVVVAGTSGTGGGTMSLSFLTPLSSLAAFFTFSDSLSIQAFDSGNNLLGSVASAASDVLGSWEMISVNFSGIASVLITGDSVFTMDDLTTSQSQVPEPSTLLLFAAAGVAGAGTGRRGSRRSRDSESLAS